MKKKEIQQIAKKLAKQETILNNSNSSLKEKSLAEQEIIKICSTIKSLEDMELIDEAVQEILDF